MRNMISAMNSQPKSDKEMEIQDLLHATEEENQDKERGTGPQQDLGEDGKFLEEPFEDDNFDRDPDNEEVYDYFLDANKDENQNENQGYHIIDQEDLKKQDDGDDPDDLDQIQDDELREYRYNN